MADRWETLETVADFIFLGSKITGDGDNGDEMMVMMKVMVVMMRFSLFIKN